MNSQCARCSKTVYPVEKLNVMDKFWHKGCFKCETCNLTLNLKTYKGYNKLPYCHVHYPTTKFTAVADTPENLRLKKQTEGLSLINYHKAYNTSVKGTKMSVADDPESLRAKKTQSQLSQIQYHGKDRSNPSSTPLSRPAFSAPGYVTQHSGDYDGNGEPPLIPDPVQDEPEDPVTIPPKSPSPEPEEEEVEVPPPAPAAAQPPPPPPAAEEESRAGKVKALARAYQDPAGIPAPVEDEAPPAPEEPPAVAEAPAPPPADEEPLAPEPGKAWVALYEYVAADEDEVTIKEGDVITQGVVVGEGWMVGTNTRTGQHGMLPSNYVEEQEGA